MLNDRYRAELYGREVDVRWTSFTGTLELEAPVNITHVSASGHCRVGAFTYTNHTCEIANTDIGRYCSIGQNTTINPGVHPVDFLTTHPLASTREGVVAGMGDHPSFLAAAMTEIDRPAPRRNEGRAEIGHDVWIGAGAVVLNGVKIATGAIIGAGAVVSHDVPPFAIVGGVPARVLRFRFPVAIRDLILRSEWWRYDLSRLSSRNFSDVTGFIKRLEDESPPLLAPQTVVLTN